MCYHKNLIINICFYIINFLHSEIRLNYQLTSRIYTTLKLNHILLLQILIHNRLDIKRLCCKVEFIV